MNQLVNRNSRNVAAYQIANGATLPVFVGGDFFYIHAVSGTLTVSVNDGPFTPCPVGLIHSGVPGQSEIGLVQFRNASGSAVDITVIYGKGSMSITGQVSIVNPQFSLSASDLLAITPAAATLTPDFDTVSNASQNFQNKKSLAVINTGETNITVGGKTLTPGESRSWSVFRQQDKLADVTVDATGGGEAIVTHLA